MIKLSNRPSINQNLYVYGNSASKSKLATIVNNADTVTQRVAVFGNSQETFEGGSGTAYGFYLLGLAAEAFNSGKFSESSYVDMVATNGSQAGSWVATKGGGTSADISVIDSNDLPVGVGQYQMYYSTSSSAVRNAAVMIVDGSGGVVDDWDTSKVYFDNTAEFIVDIIGIKRVGATSASFSMRMDDNIVPGGAFTLFTGGTLNEFEGTDGTLFKVSTDPATISNVASYPYPSVEWDTDNASPGVRSGYVGMRFRLTTDQGGFTFQSFSTGGWRMDQAIARNGSGIVTLMGLMGPYAYSMVQLGTNDIYSANRTAEDIFIDCLELIKLIRTQMADSNHLVVICTETPRINGNDTQDGNYFKYHSMIKAYAETADNVLCFDIAGYVNRLDQPWTIAAEEARSSTLYLSDNVHYNQLGSRRVAEAVIACMGSV